MSLGSGISGKIGFNGDGHKIIGDLVHHGKPGVYPAKLYSRLSPRVCKMAVTLAVRW